MFFVRTCHLPVYTAKTKIHGFLVLTSSKRFTYINAEEPRGGFQKQMYVFAFAQPLFPATGKCPSGVFSPLWPYRKAIIKLIPTTSDDEKRNSFTVKIEVH